MSPKIFNTETSSEFYTAERCHIIEIMNQPGIEFSIARARVEPGVTTAFHLLKGTSRNRFMGTRYWEFGIGPKDSFGGNWDGACGKAR
jgi:hypothetical protein